MIFNRAGKSQITISNDQNIYHGERTESLCTQSGNDSSWDTQGGVWNLEFGYWNLSFDSAQDGEFVELFGIWLLVLGICDIQIKPT